MLLKNNTLVTALCAGLMLSIGSLAFGADAPGEDQSAFGSEESAEAFSPTVDSSIAEDFAYCVERLRPYATSQNGIILGGGIFGLGLAVKAFEKVFVPAIKEDMNVLDLAQGINTRTSSVMKVGLLGGALAAGLASSAFIREGLKPREDGAFENKRQYQAMAGFGLGIACLGLAAKWLGYGVAKVS